MDKKFKQEQIEKFVKMPKEMIDFLVNYSFNYYMLPEFSKRETY